ncbi:MAG: Uma2 family endonuclease [Oculatellaceae cyanobacterium Prado106]|jgi:Uma2 family endonuclease|nr:Uma2 family endonuclease [Oculatellaceae cyanobacterium Prado106]
MAPKQPPTEQRVILPNISWTQFEQLIQELGVERETRLTYWRGKLEMMTPVAEHERCHKLMESLILVMADELRMPVKTIAPVTLKNPDLGCATEPDACYYFHASGNQLPNQTTLYFPEDPIPDLLVEVALTKSNLEKLPLYANLGIPEVWRYITTAGEDVLKGQLLIYRLQDSRYIAHSTSGIFPFLPANRILEFLEQSDSMSLSVALRVLRAWIQEKL